LLQSAETQLPSKQKPLLMRTLRLRGRNTAVFLMH